MINTLHHQEIFDAAAYADKQIVIVGLGAIGSRVFEALASTGLTNITCIDFDVVESHNLANQLFLKSDIGRSKVLACATWAKEKGCHTANMHFINGEVKPDCIGWLEEASVVICCVDTFKARKTVQELATAAHAQVFIEAGMATGHCSTFMLNPLNKSSVREWTATLGDDDDPNYEVSACGSGLTVGPTATISGNIIAWNTMNWLKTGYIESKLRMGMSPFMVSRIPDR